MSLNRHGWGRPFAKGFQLTKLCRTLRQPIARIRARPQVHRHGVLPLCSERVRIRVIGDFLSIPYLNAAWTTKCPTSTSKLVLVALADHANAAGGSFPSIARIAERCGLTERAVQLQIRKLEQAKLLKTKFNAGEVSDYHLLFVPEPTPEPRSPHPRTVFTPPPNKVHPTPEPRSPKPSVTINQPKGNLSPAERISLEKERERLVEEKKSVRDGASHTAWGPKYDTLEASRLSEIKERLRDIDAALFIRLK